MAFRKGCIPWNKGKKPLKKCLGCEKMVRIWQTYCSSKCYYTYVDVVSHLPKDVSGNKNAFYGKKHTDETKCKMSKNSAHNRYWLGKKRIDMEKSNHWNWKGGITTEDKLQRMKFRREIQKLIFERDNYTCQMCNLSNVHLQVDHIQPWAEYVELRFDMNNCRTLCDKCHYKITFGRPMPENVKVWGQNLNQLERMVI